MLHGVSLLHLFFSSVILINRDPHLFCISLLCDLLFCFDREWEDVTLTEEEITTSINREKQVSEQQQAFPDPYQAEIAPQPRYEACSSSQPPEPSEVAEQFQQVSILQEEALSEAIQHGAVSSKVKTGKRCTVKANQFCVVLPDKGLHQYDVSSLAVCVYWY